MYHFKNFKIELLCLVVDLWICILTSFSEDRDFILRAPGNIVLSLNDKKLLNESRN